jgi:hypothetical protein
MEWTGALDGGFWVQVAARMRQTGPWQAYQAGSLFYLKVPGKGV